MFLKKINKLKNTLLFRLAVLYAVTFTVLSTIGFLIFYYQIYAVTMDRLDVELLDETQRYSQLLRQSGLAQVKREITEESSPENPDEEFYRIFDFKGQTILSTDMSSWGPVAKKEILQEMTKDEATYTTKTLSIEGRDDKARLMTAIIGPNTVLQIGETLEEVEDYLDIFIKLFTILVISLIGMSTVIGWLLARRATNDMQEVTETAEEITNGAYDRRVQTKGRLNEIEHLGATFNRMLDRIQSLLKSLKEINDNIAHDLRSPLARIRGIAEMNLMKEKSIDDYKEMAASTIEECDALISMINTMLDITEAEAGVNGAQVEEFDLAALIRGACELFHPLAENKNVRLETHLPDTLLIESDRKKMQRIVTNLLENAIKYSSADGKVAVSLVAGNGLIQIEFKDSGIGISENDLAHIFERFYRCDRSRSQGGIGLGLSLVKAYIESINGSVHVESALDQGSRFTLKFSG